MLVALASAMIAGVITSGVFKFLFDSQNELFSHLGTAIQYKEEGPEPMSHFFKRLGIAVAALAM